MTASKCKFCGRPSGRSINGASFKFPHCNEEQNARIKNRLKQLDLKPQLSPEEKKERCRLMKAMLGVRYATPSKNPNL